MAKTLDKIGLFVNGNPAEDEPSSAFFVYNVVSGKATKRNQSLAINEPDFSKTAEQFWSDGVTAIEEKEGI